MADRSNTHGHWNSRSSPLLATASSFAASSPPPPPSPPLPTSSNTQSRAPGPNIPSISPSTISSSITRQTASQVHSHSVRDSAPTTASNLNLATTSSHTNTNTSPKAALAPTPRTRAPSGTTADSLGASRKALSSSPSTASASSQSAAASDGSRPTTRSSARQAARSARPAGAPSGPSLDSPSAPASAVGTSSKKRKPSDNSTVPDGSAEHASSGRRTKRARASEQPRPPAAIPAAPTATPTQPPAYSFRKRKGKQATTMSSPESAAGPSIPPSDNVPSASSSRKSSRNKKNAPSAGPSASSSSRRSRKKPNNNPDEDTPMTGTDDNEKTAPPHESPQNQDYHGEDSDGEEDESHRRYPEDDDGDDGEDDDVFGGFGPPGGLSSTLAALSNIMSGMNARLRDILSNLRQKEDTTLHLVALNELSEILLISNEDNLQGHFSTDSFVRELVSLMKPDDFTEANPETMLLACRCLANLMEALPSSVTNVVYAGAVPVLCEKLRDIQFIDLAEQALSTLEKVSVEYPASIVKEGGLAACLEYLDFFPMSTQRTAVTTAANCCRNLPHDYFNVVKDAMRILRDVLKNSDQRVVEQASICVSRIVETWRQTPSKLEALVSEDLLSSILRLLLPGSTNLIGPSIHTQFLRVLASTAKASPSLSVELMKMNVVETLYQVLTGVSPPNGTDDVASKLDSVLIMQALIHRPREQIIEALNVVCELLPRVPAGAPDPTRAGIIEPVAGEANTAGSSLPSSSRRRSSDDKRVQLLEGCKAEVRRFALILFPTLTDAFSSTVNLTVRQKVLLAQLKMLHNLDVDILTEALAPVPYASFLASIVSQKDDLSLVAGALQATDLLMTRLGNIYQYQLYREGVITEIAKLANETEPDAKTVNSGLDRLPRRPSHGSADQSSDDEDEEVSDGDDEAHQGEEDEDDEGSHRSSDDDERDEDNEDDEDEEENEHEAAPPRVLSGSPGSSSGSTMSLDAPPPPPFTATQLLRSKIHKAAADFLVTHETEKNAKHMKKKATKILDDMSQLAQDIEAFYLRPTSSPSVANESGKRLFTKLAGYFDSDLFESATSAELLDSGIVRILEQVFSNPDEDLAMAAQAAFIEVFMGYTVKSKPKTATADSPATPFSMMVHKLQDLLSRSEHFEVFTVSSSSHGDNHRSNPASMLAKQIRLKLTADEDSDIPRVYRNIMVSIHAIATFKSLEDYLRPRISLSERPRPSRAGRDSLSRALAAMAGGAFPFGAGVPGGSARLPSRLPPPMGAAAATTPPPPPPPPAQPAASSSRASRKTNTRSSPSTDAPSAPDTAAASAAGAKVVLRRSARRNPSTADSPQPSRPPPEEDDDLEDALECADEKHIDEEEDTGDRSALDAIVGDLDEDMDDAPTPDPSAVNLEVSGNKITARKEDGTRVPTPSSSGASSTLAQRSSMLANALMNSPSSSSSRPMSYAAAIQAIPQDWHLEFSHQGKIVSNETTIYRAVQKLGSDDFSIRNVWAQTHEIKIRRVPGPPSAETLSFGSTSNEETESGDGHVPASLAKHPTTASILRLLKILHNLNANIDDVIVENKAILKLNREPLSQFVNTKLTAKLNRQLEEPLIVASNCLPSWSEDLARLHPFLFPFETRHLFLQSTSFGYARSMNRWQNAQAQDDSRRHRDDRPFLGRLQRQKVRISRSKILESALKVMDLYGSSQSILEVEYFEEVGTGLGPTLEFYSTVSKEFATKKLKMWRDSDGPHAEADEYVSAPNGLFPRPYGEDGFSNSSGERVLQLFRTLGKFVARSMIDSRIIDINLNPIFFRIGDESSGIKPSLGAMKLVDPVLARSLVLVKKFAIAKKEIAEDPNRNATQKVNDIHALTIDHGVRIEDLSLDFTLPGYADIELGPGGSQVMLTIDNVDQYLERVIDMTLGSGVRRQVDAFRTGFSQVFPYQALSAFTPEELCTLFGRVDEDWSLATLMDSIKADHGFNMDSKSVRNLLQTMSEFTPAQRRDFLQFTTGSPKLPIGGFKSLTPMFTVVCKPSEGPYSSDDYLPSVMTCVNYLKLPDYSDINVLKKQLFTAMKEGQGAFHLS